MFIFSFFHESLDGNKFSHTCDFTSDNVGADGLFFFFFFNREEMETLLVSITTSIDTYGYGKVQNISKIRQPGNLYAVETSHYLNITAY